MYTKTAPDCFMLCSRRRHSLFCSLYATGPLLYFVQKGLFYVRVPTKQKLHMSVIPRNTLCIPTKPVIIPFYLILIGLSILRVSSNAYLLAEWRTFGICNLII